MRIPLLYRGEYSQWVERFMNYLEEQTDGEAMINSIKNGEPYYKEYLEKVAKHQRYLAGEKGSDPDSPAPNPAKATKKSNPSAPKADLRPPVIKLASSQQPEPKSAPAKSQGMKRNLVTETSDKPSPARRSKPGLVTKRRKPTSSLRQKRVIDDFKPMDSDDAVEKEKVLEEPGNTKIEVKQEGDEENIRKRPGRRLKMKATKKSKRQKTDSDLKEEEHLKTFLFDRMDLEELYNLVMQERRYPLTKETLERMLALRLIANCKSEAIFDLLRLIQKQIDESRSHDGSEKDLKELASPKQTALVINDLKKCGYKKDNCELNYMFLNNLQPEWKQYGTLIRQTKNLMDINIDALYNILKQNQGDVIDALGYKKKAVVVTSDPLALVGEKTKVSKQKEKVVVSSDSEGSGVDYFSELKKITALLAKAFNQRKFYSKPTNNNLRTSSTSQSANKKQEFVKLDDKKEDKKADEKKTDMSKVKCYNCMKEGYFAKDCKKAKVKDYNYYKTNMLLAMKDSDEQVLLAEDQAWMESSSDSDQEINANMVFMA
nr:hypothetical protein [Tanacetum cinerariifolium]